MASMREVNSHAIMRSLWTRISAKASRSLPSDNSLLTRLLNVLTSSCVIIQLCVVMNDSIIVVSKNHAIRYLRRIISRW